MDDMSMESLLDPSKLDLQSSDWNRIGNSHELTLVHMQEKEVEPLIALQGEEIFEEVEGLGKVYSFPKLAPMFDNPAIRRLFIDSVHHERSKNPEKHDLLNELYEEGLAHVPDISSQVPGESEGQEALAEEGQDGDNMIVQLPLNVVKTFIEIEGKKPNINSETGLLAFGRGWKNDLIRGLTTAVGAVYGGGTGAALGHMAGRMATGQKFQDTLVPSAKVGIGTYALQHLLPHVPGVKQGIEKLSQYYPSVGKGVGALAGVNPTLNMPGFSHVANMGNEAVWGAVKGLMPSSESLATAAESGAKPETQSSSKDGESSSLKGMLKDIVPLGLIHGLNYAAEKRQDKEMEKQRLKMEEAREKERARHHLDEPWKVPTFKRKYKNPNYIPGGQEPYYLYENEAYAKGGPVSSPTFVKKTVEFAIKGPGKGQDDLISTKLEPGGFIVPADVTAMFGDGATDAGHKALKSFEEQYKPFLKKKRGGSVPRPKSPIDAYVANGETSFSEPFVTAVGHGSNDRGAHLLDKMMKRIRIHKQSNGHDLPPKAFSPEVYIFGR